jgi:hypothetical protein
VAQFSDKALQGMIDGEVIAQGDAPRLAREAMRLRKEARALRKFLDARGLWTEYQQEARTVPAGKPAGKTAGKPAGKSAGQPAGAAV